MKRVLIFTDVDSWDPIDLGDYSDVKDLWDPMYPDDLRKVVMFDLSGTGPASLVSVDDCLQEGVYLMYDEMDEVSFHNLTDSCTGEDTFVLVHTSGLWIKETIPAHLQKNCLEGKHINRDDSFLYCPVFRKLADESGNKMERVLDFLVREQLRKACHLFLSGCMKPYNGDKDFLAAKDRLVADPRFGTLVHDFYENVYPNVTKAGERPPRTYRSYKGQFIPVRNALNATLWP